MLLHQSLQIIIPNNQSKRPMSQATESYSQSTKYTEGVLMAVKSPLLGHVSTVAAFIILSAFCTGMLIGRVIKYLLVLLGRLA